LASIYGGAVSGAKSFAYPTETVKGMFEMLTVPGVAVGVGKGMVKQAKQNPFEFAGEQIGQIGITSLIIDYGIPKGVKLVKTLGRENIPMSDLIPQDVLVGKKTFPEKGTKSMSIKQRQELHLQEFLYKSQRLPGQEKPMGYHATAEPFKDLTIKGSKSEYPGLFMSSGVSPHFLRISGESKFKIFGSLKDLFKVPKVLAIEPKEFVKGTSAKPGQAFIPGVKTEIEAILSPETKLVPKGKQYYFKYKERVPIDEFEVVGDITKLPKEKIGKIKILKDIESEYYLPGSKALIYPQTSIISNLLSSGKHSLVPSSLYGIPSSKVSMSKAFGVPSSIISKPTPSKTGISKITYKPFDMGLSTPSTTKTPKEVLMFNLREKPIIPTPKLKMDIKFKGLEEKPKEQLFKTKPKYEPSLMALELNIIGKATKGALQTATEKGVMSGLQIRKLPKGFKFEELPSLSMELPTSKMFGSNIKLGKKKKLKKRRLF
jgi:hypothetical protein